jgi:hypothetical protein
MRLFLTLATLAATLTAHAAAAVTIATAIPKPGGASAMLEAEVLYEPSFEELDVGDPSDFVNFPFISALVAPNGMPNNDFDGLNYASGTGSVIGNLIETKLDVDDTVDLLFEVTANDTGEHWGNFVLVTLFTGFDPGAGGLEQFPGFSANAGADADVTLQAVQPIPLPAALPMLMGGLGALVLAGRRRRS